MPDTTRRSFLIGAGALAAAVATPLKQAQAVATISNQLTITIGCFDVEGIVEMIHGYRVKLRQAMGLPEQIVQQITVPSSEQLSVKHNIRSLYGKQQFPVAFANDGITVELDLSRGQAALLELGDHVSLNVSGFQVATAGTLPTGLTKQG